MVGTEGTEEGSMARFARLRFLLRALRAYHENVSVAGVVVGELAWSGGPWLEADLVCEITQASHQVGSGAARFERVEIGRGLCSRRPWRAFDKQRSGFCGRW